MGKKKSRDSEILADTNPLVHNSPSVEYKERTAEQNDVLLLKKPDFEFADCGGKICRPSREVKECTSKLQHLSIKSRDAKDTSKVGEEDQNKFVYCCDTEYCTKFREENDKKKLNIEMTWASICIKSVDTVFKNNKEMVEKEYEKISKLKSKFSALGEEFGNKWRMVCREMIDYWNKQLHESSLVDVCAKMMNDQKNIDQLKKDIDVLKTEMKINEKIIAQVKSYLNTNLFIRHEDTIGKTEEQRELSTKDFNWKVRIVEIQSKNKEYEETSKKYEENISKEFNSGAQEKFDEVCNRVILKGFIESRTKKDYEAKQTKEVSNQISEVPKEEPKIDTQESIEDKQISS